ncbi:MAG: elongation factor G, partial [Clostridia bacterium]|nr:elongation factor G [Clostridia bacterium]
MLTGDMTLYNANAEKTEKPGTIYYMLGKKTNPINKGVAGDIIALAKLVSVSTGNTLCDQAKPIVFPPLNFPAPCIGMAVYAKKAGDEDKIFSG